MANYRRPERGQQQLEGKCGWGKGQKAATLEEDL